MPTPHPQPRRPRVAEIIGQRGRHRVLRRLGEGGMAETFLATAANEGADLPHLYCIKRMHMHPTVSRADFEEEARVHLELCHGLVVRAYGLDEDEHGLLFLVLEYVDGINLQQLLDFYGAVRRRLPVGLSVHIMHEAAEALHYVHSFVSPQLRNLIHRDISPSNVLISRDGFVKLADFGIAARDGRARLTRTGVAKGKTPYLAPERFDLARGVDQRSDLFSLGVVFYELLCGENPFAAEHEGDAPVMRAIMAGEFEPISSYAPGLSSTLLTLVTQLLENDKAQRPASALEVVARLESLELLASIERTPAPRLALADVVNACLTTPAPGRTEDERQLQRADEVLALGEHILRPAPLEESGGGPRGEGTRSREIMIADRTRSTARGGELTGPPTPRPESSRHSASDLPVGAWSGFPSPRRPRLFAAAATLFVLASALVVGVLWQDSSPSGRPAPPLPTAPAAQPSATEAPRAEPAPAVASAPPQAPPPSSQPADRARAAAPSAARRPDDLPDPSNDGRPHDAETGMLVVQVDQWGYVHVDKKLVGFAPVRVRLSAGPHLVEVSESDTDRALNGKRMTVHVPPGKTVRRTVVLQEGSGLFERSPNL